MSKCLHEKFRAEVNVNRLSDIGRFSADVKIRCEQCGSVFRFIGLPCGIDLNGAAVNPDATEARLAIAPLGEVVPAIEGPQGFSARRSEHEGAGEIVAAVNELRAEGGACVEFCCPNEDFNGQPDEIVDVTASWTDWEPRRFGGDTLLAALQLALAAKRESEARK